MSANKGDVIDVFTNNIRDHFQLRGLQIRGEMWISFIAGVAVAVMVQFRLRTVTARRLQVTNHWSQSISSHMSRTGCNLRNAKGNISIGCQ